MKTINFFKPPCISLLIQAMSKYLLCAMCRHPEGRVFELVVESMQFTHSVLFSENSKKLPRAVGRQVGKSGSAARRSYDDGGACVSTRGLDGRGFLLLSIIQNV